MEPVAVDTIRFEAEPGVTLEGDRLTPADAVGQAVVCHPHPLYGGSRQDAVVGTVCRTLVGAGWDVLRFDFRGTGGSSGSHGGGPGEQHDLAAAIDLMAGDGPLVVAGYSFGADVALSVDDPRITRWITVAPVLSVFTEFAAASDPRPKTLIAAAHDQFQPASQLRAATDAWHATDVVAIDGADHFFHGAQRAIDAALVAAIS
ncbi:MAG: alpha/beta hydrolase [Actinomycetota bacterium]